MAGWHHRLDGLTPGDGDGQGGLACCDSWGRKESDTTERLNWTELTDIYQKINIITVYTKRTKEKVTAQEMFTIYISYKEKAMAPHSSTLAWKIPWMEEPGRLQSVGSQRVGHNWATWLSLFTFMHWRRKWQPTPVFLPGESQGRGSLVGCRLWGRRESDMTEAT